MKQDGSNKPITQFETVFVGHTTTTHIHGSTEPFIGCGVVGVDTGGGWEGVITIMDVDTLDYWQSDCVKDLYPEAAGRRRR